MSVHTGLACGPIFNFGTEEQKKKFLTPMAKGEHLGAFALTEPGAGTDVGAATSTAVLDGDEYVLNGVKTFTSNGPVANTYVTFAWTDKNDKRNGMTAFIVPRETPGLSVGEEFKKMGIRASQTSEIIFKDCRVPKENVLGKVGDGLKIAMNSFDHGRIGIAAQAVGIAEAAFEAARDYAKERVQFGQPISEFQAIQWMLADMKTRLEAARLLTYQAALAKDEAARKGGRYSLEASMAKLYASEMAMWVTTTAVQIFGGNGYSKEYPVERYFRDAKITEIYEGTSEIQRMVIARSVLS